MGRKFQQQAGGIGVARAGVRLSAFSACPRLKRTKTLSLAAIFQALSTYHDAGLSNAAASAKATFQNILTACGRIERGTGHAGISGLNGGRRICNGVWRRSQKIPNLLPPHKRLRTLTADAGRTATHSYGTCA